MHDGQIQTEIIIAQMGLRIKTKTILRFVKEVKEGSEPDFFSAFQKLHPFQF